MQHFTSVRLNLYKSKQTLNLLIKLAILSLVAYFIYRQLYNNKNLHTFSQLIQSLPKRRTHRTLLLVFMMMFLNWFIESWKWKFLVKRIERISLLRAIESVFCGLSWAIITPNRLGEYGGRIFFLSPRQRVFGLVAMGVGGLGQMVITQLGGALAILWFVEKFLALSPWLYRALAFLITLYGILLLFFYFNIPLVNSKIKKTKWLSPLRKVFAVLTRYHKKDLVIVLLYSMLRFIVFTSQYNILINLLMPELPLFSATMMVMALFLVQMVLPSLDLLDVGVRGMVASYFFSFITPYNVPVIATTTCIWFINLVVPGILGSLFVFKLNFFGTKRY